MLPDIGASEIMVIAIVALIVVGPKDLPMLLRKLGQFMAKLRGMAADFRASFDEMARQSELDELRKEVEAMRQNQFTDLAADANRAVAEIDQSFAEVGVDLQNTATYDYTPSEPPPTMEALPSEVPKKPRARKAAASKTAAAPKAAAASTPRKPRAKKAAGE